MPANKIVKFGSYYLTSKIATGGMAEIFRGRKVGAAGFEKLVVIKRLLPHLAADEEFRTMFLNEAKLASLLNHQNIVQVYDLGRMEEDDSLEPGQQGTYFIAMEYIFGKSLAEVMKKGQARVLPLPQELAVRIILAAALGLAYAHGKKGEDGRPLGLVHRDVSPQNILISYEGEVKLVDFGIAKAMSQSSSTRPGVLKGKFAYMAPEQARGQVDQRADIYSLGVVFWEALTGQRLFQGDNEAALLAQVLNPQVGPPSGVRAEIPPELDALCLTCLAQDPGQRFANAQALSEALEAYLYTLKTFPSTYSLRNHLRELFGPEIAAESQQIQAEGESARQAAGQTPATPETPTAPAPPLESTRVVPRPAPGGRGMVYGLALAGVTLAAGLAWWLWPGPPPPGPAPQPPAPTATAPAPTTATEGRPPAPPEPATPTPPPPPPDPRLEQAKAQVRQGDFEQALATLAPEAAPPGGWGQAGDRLRAQALLGRALARLEEDPQTALADLDQAVSLAPDWAEVHFQAGRVQTRLKNLEQALAAYGQALELDPRLDGAHFNSGYIHLEQGRLEQAIAAFQKVVDLGSPFAADAQVNLAVCYHKQGKRDEALRHLQAALLLNPNHKLALSYLERLRKGGPGAGGTKK
ncbi:MAG: protein kinase [Desulfarculus sp.]|nr:protein kinase [Desulfarculus sp.]